MANEKYLTESIKYYTEIFRLVWLSILAVGGGSIGLLLGESTGVRLIFAIVGLMVVGLLLDILRRLNKQIGGNLKKLMEVENA
jgi:hypothetical protein